MPRPTVHSKPFGSAHGRAEVDIWTLDSGTGVQAEVLTYGAALHTLTVPDISGAVVSVVRSLATIEDYTGDNPYFGAVVGRYANRIAHGRFALDGTTHHIPANDRGHALHGGPDGFHKRIWGAVPHSTDCHAALLLTLHSPDGDMGFPGALDVSVTYTLSTTGTLVADYTATTTRPTVVNLTNHSYFDLTGEGDILGHRLQVDADAYLPVDASGIPLGSPVVVRGTPFDFTTPRTMGERISLPDDQLYAAGGYDHCWILREPTGGKPDGLRRAARLVAPDASRTMEVWTTEPGIQVYTANQLDGSLADAAGRRHERHSAVCLETQHLPDSPNRPGYPSTFLLPGDTARSRTEWRFPHLEGSGRGRQGNGA